jgi:hypothetical protein
MKLLPILLLGLPLGAFAGGSVVKWRNDAGDHVVTLFSSPAVLMAGPVNLRVLVQDRMGVPVQDADVRLTLSEQTSGARDQIRAEPQSDHDNRTYCAQASLPVPGKWNVKVAVQDGESRIETSGVIEVLSNPIPEASYWGYVLFLPILLLAFVYHGWFARPQEP